MIISIIAAIGPKRELGKNNKLLWHISEDFKRFKKITKNHAVIMGRKTFESIGKPLSNRLNIILSRHSGDPPAGKVIYVTSLEQAISFVKDKKILTSSYYPLITNQEVFIIGGGQIYQQAISLADKLYLTIVNKTPEHPDGKFEADTFFPDYSAFKKVVFKEKKKSEGYEYTFLDLTR